MPDALAVVRLETAKQTVSAALRRQLLALYAVEAVSRETSLGPHDQADYFEAGVLSRLETAGLVTRWRTRRYGGQQTRYFLSPRGLLLARVFTADSSKG